jgi:hypothetical protein
MNSSRRTQDLTGNSGNEDRPKWVAEIAQTCRASAAPPFQHSITPKLHYSIPRCRNAKIVQTSGASAAPPFLSSLIH